VLDLLKSKYQGFGPTLACEKLVEIEGLPISAESVRQLRIAEELWKPRKARKVVTHGRLGQLLFVESESFFSYCQAAAGYFTRHGKPAAFYSDKHGIFRVNQPASGTTDALTQFGRAMQQLDIQIICAHTPQAKTRVERAIQTLQDRPPKELRLRNLSSWEAGNAYLPEFMNDFNQRFAVHPPVSSIPNNWTRHCETHRNPTSRLPITPGAKALPPRSRKVEMSPCKGTSLLWINGISLLWVDW